MNKTSQRGSAIIMLFIAVALFAALGYAFFQGSRTSTSMMTGEASKAKGAEMQDCTNTVTMATKRLQLRGCGTRISLALDGTNTNPGAPTDGSCSVYHPNGGGAKACTMVPTCVLTSLAIGQGCDGVIYAGSLSGRRIYTNGADLISIRFNTGGGNPLNPPGVATSTSDGMLNTNQLLAQSNTETPYVAAQTCRALGPKWYMPSSDEMEVVLNARNQGLLNGTLKTMPLNGYPFAYYQISQLSTAGPWQVRIIAAYRTDTLSFEILATFKSSTDPLALRCVRGD
jgi:hypothetical protein